MKKIIDFLDIKTSCNSIYYFAFFLILQGLNVFYTLHSPLESLRTKALFFSLHFLQSFITVCALLCFGSVLKALKTSFFYAAYVGGVFLLLFIAIFEAFLIILMDVSIKDGLDIAFGADWDNFIELLYLSDIGMIVWIGALVLAIGIPFIGIGVYRFFHHFHAKLPQLSHGKIVYSLLCSIFFLIGVDGFFFFNTEPLHYERNKKTLLWKENFFKTKTEAISLNRPLEVFKIDQEKKNNTSLKTKSLPNIYLIIAESLREDFITKAHTPNLVSFKESNISADSSFSNSNCTHLSWFSIFYSRYPFAWSYKEAKRMEKGSPNLCYLKELGYKIHLYTSAQMKFYHFDETLFGKERYLLSSYAYYPHYEKKEASESDLDVIQAFLKDSEEHKNEGQVYLIFLDCTHFNYSWPKESFEEFTPYGELTWKMRLSHQTEELELLKNRYRNSLRYLDNLFAQVTNHLKKKKCFDSSIVVFTGDHGEEFKEEGKLFHASHLSKVQIKTPIFYKLGNKKKKISLTSHVDIFPSIIEYITHQSLPYYADGQSVLALERKPFILAARYNASHHPYKFMIHDEKDGVLFKLGDKNGLMCKNQIRCYSFLDDERKKKFENYLYQAFPVTNTMP